MMKLAVKTLGCRLNQAESATLSGIMRDRGWDIVPFGDQADAVLVHSCTITEKALKKTLGFCRRAKKDNPDATVVLAGCAVEVAGKQLQETGGADILLDQADKLDIANRISAHINAEAGNAHKPSPNINQTVIPFHTTTRAPVKIQNGCSFHCAYCIVPQARGPSVSRDPDQILNEIDNLCKSGFKEIILTGANLGCYRCDKTGLVELIQRIEDKTDIERIRLSSIEPTTAENDVINFMSTSRKLCRSLHVPLQSGDNQILKKMGRRYTREEYLRFVHRAIDSVENLGLGTDIIAGFPSETDSAFENTLNLVDEIPFSNIHAFSYSRRPGTAAAKMSGVSDRETISRRVKILREKGAEKRQIFAQKLIGKSCAVLVEKTDPGKSAEGLTSEYLPASLPDTEAKINDIITFRPTSAENGTLMGGSDENGF